MTTSYELSLKLLELGVEQWTGEYYWVESPIANKPCIAHGSDASHVERICRAFTLGEIVREFGDCQIAITKLLNFNSVTMTSLNEPITGISEISPEEAAGELLAEIKEQEKLKA